MDVERIREYVAMVEEGSLTQAAKRLHITQSALSKHLAALENTLGVQLLERNGSGVLPTVAGQQFYQDSVNVVMAYDQAMDNISRYYASAPITLSVAAFVGYKPTDDMLVSAEAKLAKLGTNVHFAVHDFTSTTPFDELRQGKADLCLMAHSPNADLTGLVSVPLIWEPAVAIVPSGNALAKRDFLKVNDLNGNMVWEVGTKGFASFNAYLEELLSERGAEPQFMRIAGTNTRQLYSAGAYIEGGLWVNFASIAKYSTPVSANYRIIPFGDDLTFVVNAVYRRGDKTCEGIINVFRDVLLNTPLEVYWKL